MLFHQAKNLRYALAICFILLVANLILSSKLQAKIAANENQLTPLLNGHQLPNVELKQLDGQSVALTELTDNKPSVIFFYRGGWCPYCNAQMGQLKAIEQQLIDMGFQLIGISPDTPKQLKQSVKDNELNYQLLSDASHKASQAFGLAYFTSERVTQRYTQKMGITNPLTTTPNGEKRLVLPVPAVYISDGKGLIHFQYINPNFSVRPAPELILTAAKLVSNKAL